MVRIILVVSSTLCCCWMVSVSFADHCNTRRCANDEVCFLVTCSVTNVRSHARIVRFDDCDGRRGGHFESDLRDVWVDPPRHCEPDTDSAYLGQPVTVTHLSETRAATLNDSSGSIPRPSRTRPSKSQSRSTFILALGATFPRTSSAAKSYLEPRFCGFGANLRPRPLHSLTRPATTVTFHATGASRWCCHNLWNNNAQYNFYTYSTCTRTTVVRTCRRTRSIFRCTNPNKNFFFSQNIDFQIWDGDESEPPRQKLARTCYLTFSHESFCWLAN